MANDATAPIVRVVFERYAELGSLIRLAEDLNRRCIGRGPDTRGFKAWNRVNLHRLLTNAVYIGKVQLDGKLYPGEHKGLVPKKLFDRVQRLTEKNRTDGGAAHRNRHGALLRGLLRCAACDAAMTHVVTKRRQRAHRYYRCQQAQKRGHDACPTKAIRANMVEAFVVDQVRRIGADPGLQDETFRQAVAQVKARRRGLNLERKRLVDDLTRARGTVERLVGTVARVNGTAADAVAAELAKAQARVAALEARHGDIATELASLDGQATSREDFARALVEFDPIWDVLLTPERERVLALLIERIDYRGDTQELTIRWRLAGFGQLGVEVAP